jgi:23S rRNA (cytidine1920-2'-O)/16S rRNA (cytidine1409-2'-O)-methyltransferase
VFKFDPGELTALDLGASTGGFTQVLLQRGARHVLAVDVGRDQMNATLRSDPRVTCIEGLNARDLTSADLGRLVPQALVCDVSFISLKLALPPALTLAAPGAWGVFLVKPQFEAGRAAIGKGGLLRDKEDADRIAADLTDWLNNQPGWRSTGLTPSPIRGQDGNREFLLGGVKDQ